MSILLFALLAVLGGIAVATQGSANAALARPLGLPAALFISTSIVWLFCFAWYAAAGFPSLWQRGIPAPHLVGGICGFLIITAAAIAFPRIGPAFALALFLVGQLGAALLIEHRGWFGVEPVAFSKPRLLGVALLLAGAWLLKRG